MALNECGIRPAGDGASLQQEQYVLDGINDVDWAALDHAYGSAADVPDLLRALASSDTAEQKQALHRLFGTIWHQGTVYPATAAAVPFLYAILKASNGITKSGVAALLAGIADARGYLEVHSVSEFGQKSWRKILAEQGKTLEAEREREAAATRRVHQAAAAGLLDLLPFLTDPEPETRRAVAVALGRYPQYKPITLPALHSAAEVETDEAVQAALGASIDGLEAASA